MGARERPSALAGVEREPRRRHHFDHRRALHVAKLAPVEVAVGLRPLGPAEVDVARSLHHPLPLHDALSRVLVATLGQVILEHRGRRLLDL